MMEFFAEMESPHAFLDWRIMTNQLLETWKTATRRSAFHLLAAVTVLLTPWQCSGQGVLTVLLGYPSLLDARAVAVDGAGNAYVWDTIASTVLKVNTAGTVTKVAGSGGFGFSGDGGPAINAKLAIPTPRGDWPWIAQGTCISRTPPTLASAK